MSNRRTHSSEIKVRVAMEAISGLKTIQQIAAKEAELFQQIGRLQMELEWLKKMSQQL